MGGYTDIGNFALARFTSAGALDTSFDSDGKQTTDFGSFDEVYAIALSPTGELDVAGSTGSGSASDFAVARYSTGSQRTDVLQDANYNVIAVVDKSGSAAIDRFVYDSYGAQTALDANWNLRPGNASQSGMATGFQGMAYDGIDRTYHTLNREYGPVLGRWTKEDPLGYVDGTNPYQAFRTAPYSARDPFGLEPDWWADPSEPADLKTMSESDLLSYLDSQINSWRKESDPSYWFAANLLEHFANNDASDYNGSAAETQLIKNSSPYRSVLQLRLQDSADATSRDGTYAVSGDFNTYYTPGIGKGLFYALGGAHFTYDGLLSVKCGHWTAGVRVTQKDYFNFRKTSIGRYFDAYEAAYQLRTRFKYRKFYDVEHWHDWFNGSVVRLD